MKNLIKFILTCALILASLAFSEKENTSSAIKEPKFLVEVNSKNPEAQLKINELKKDFYNERQEIHESYENKIKSIKKARKQDITDLKKRYRKKLRRLRKKYPDIPDVKIDSKPRPKLIPPSIDKKENKTKMKDRKKDKIPQRKKILQSDKEK